MTKLTILAALLIALIFQDSQRGPKSTNTSEAEQSQSKEQAGQPTQAQQRSEPPPPTLQPQTQPADPQTQPADTDDDGEFQRQNIAIQQQLSRFTGLLVVIGFLQIVVLAFQVAYGIKAANAAKEAAKAATKSANVAETALQVAERADVLLQAATFNIGRNLDGGVIQGRIPWRFNGEVIYNDVFGKRHISKFGGIYNSSIHGFIVEENAGD